MQHVEWDVRIPCNTTAEVCLPNGKVETLGSGSYHFSVDIPTTHAAIVKDEFLYEQASFPQCHSASIVETKKGDLVCTYFGGKHERNPDVCIWVSIKKKGSNEWSKPILAADGVFTLGTPNAQIAGPPHPIRVLGPQILAGKGGVGLMETVHGGPQVVF